MIAPLRVRAQRLAERMGVSVRTARRAARDLDRRRAQFDRTMHRADPNDPHNFDLVLDSHSLGLEIASRDHRPRRRGRTSRHACRGAGSSLRARPDSPIARPEPNRRAPELRAGPARAAGVDPLARSSADATVRRALTRREPRQADESLGRSIQSRTIDRP